MNKEDEARQIRETRSLLQKAGQRHATLETKREALRRLISLTRTNSRELKVFAAQNFSHYFKDFPDMEEEVIDCVYDVCEDSETSVRIEGYKAIVSLSSESKKWTRRNTDVLVQLLQSDEPGELEQIESALSAHIQLDPPAAIGVLCDHCSLEPDLEPEERENRTNLRKLVLIFLSRRSKRIVFPQFRNTEGEAEVVFRNGLLKALPDADDQETKLIIEELLLPLESFSTPHGNELLEILLEKTRATYTNIKSKPGPVSLQPLQPYLSLLSLVVITEKIADPGPLLRFYSMTLIGKIPLEKLDKPSQLIVIERLGDLLPVCEQARVKDPQSPSAEELTKLRNMVVDACPHLLEKLISFKTLDRREWSATVTLLNACVRRHEDQKWEAPSNLVPTLARLNILAESAPSETINLSKEASLLIKRLDTLTPSESASPTSLAQPRSTSLKRKLEPTPARTLNTSGTGSTTVVRQVEPERSLRGPKSTRASGDVNTGYILRTADAMPTPSLLDRMQDIENGHLSLQREETKSEAGAGPSPPPVTHLRIKGAAKSKDPPKAVPAQPLPTGRTPSRSTSTLLDRITWEDSNGAGRVRKRQRRHKVG